MTQAYCFKCKTKRDVDDGVVDVSPSGRSMLKGKCSTCDGNVSVFVKSSKAVKPKVEKPKADKPNKSKTQKKGKGLTGDITSIANSLITSTDLRSRVSDTLNLVLDDINEILQNPLAARYKNILVNRLPRLSLRFDKLGNKITFIQKDTSKTGTKKRANKVRKLELKRDNITSLVKSLLMALPQIAKYANERQESLIQREALKKEKEIDQLEAKIDQLDGDEGGAEWEDD